jgi:MYXO-CTERM domain-containing protein
VRTKSWIHCTLARRWGSLLPAALLVAALMLTTSAVRADLPPSCGELGFALTDHSCFHARFGPYTTVTAASGLASATAAPNVDAVHTFYDVVLPNPAGQNTVSYKVASSQRAGTWAIFHDARVPIRVLSESGQLQPVVLSHDVTSCSFLPRVDVFELGLERYRVVLGPAAVTRSVLVIENISDFTNPNGRDADGDGYGDSADAVVTPCVPALGYVQNALDCDDTNPLIHPGAAEVCDGVDQNCNGIPDDVGLPCSSGLGQCKRSGTMACNASLAPAVCSAVPGSAGVEACDGIDSDCNGTVDLGESGLCTSYDAPSCVLVLGETRCGCDADNDCGGPASGRICDLGSRRCKNGCVALSGRNGCPTGLVCSSSDPVSPGECVSPESGCTDDAGCSATPVTPYCFAPPAQLGRCVECIVDAACARREDRKIACIGPNHTCAECTAEDPSRCEATDRGSSCLPTGLCGCVDDTACAPGRTCDIARGTCTPPSDGVTDADGGPEVQPAVEDGCGCRVMGSPSKTASHRLLVVAALGVALFARRRRFAVGLGGAAASVLLLLSVVDCGGRVAILEAPNEDASGIGVGARPGADASTDLDGASTDASVDACDRVLGEKVIEHACSHGTHGPFDTVVGAEASGTPPSVNIVHHTYEIVMPAEAPPYRGAVTYTPERQGPHVLFTQPRVDLRVLSGTVALPLEYREAVAKTCAAFDEAMVVPLSKEEVIRVEIDRSPTREVKLFIEHLGTFGDEAWGTNCSP